MAFISTANTNTLELSLTDYGKSILVGNSGGDLLNQIVKFGLRDADIDYRRFTADTIHHVYGPCYTQSFEVNKDIESLSGDCFYNYPDIRGRYGVEVCNLALLQGPTTDGTTIIFNPTRDGNLWYSTVEDEEAKYCFKKGYDVTSLGLNEYGCKCSQFGLYHDDINSEENLKPGYPTYIDVIQMYNYVKNPRYFIDDKFKVGDFTGEGEINCKDFCWVVSCYTKGVGETYGGNKGNVTMANKNSFITMMMDLGCKCEGYNTKPTPTDTFMCPGDKKVYKNTKKNRNTCNKLTQTSMGSRIVMSTSNNTRNGNRSY